MENINILKKLFCFRDLTILELAKVNTIVHTPIFKSGEVVITEGVPSHSLYVIKEGAVSVSKGGTTITSLGQGDLVGEISFLDKGEPSATVTTLEETTFIEIPEDAFDELLNDNRDLAYKIMKSVTMTLCQRLRNADDLIAKRQLLLLPPSL
jgi:CRP-like cAMP-binding protein